MACRRTPGDGRSSAGRARRAASRATCERGRRAPPRSASRPPREPRASRPAGLAREHVLRPCCSRTTPTTRPKHVAATLRGAGPRGLAAMPAARSTGVWWLRPLLACRAQPSTPTHARGCAGSTTKPTPTPATAATRSATHRAGAARRTRLSGDARACGGAAGRGRGAARRPCRARRARCVRGRDARLRASSRARRAPRGNVLRWFLREQRLPSPSRARLADALASCSATLPARGSNRHAGAESASPRPTRRPVRPVDPIVRVARPEHVVPHGTLRLSRRLGVGIAARHSRTLRHIRSGSRGERIRLTGQPRRNVADLLREARAAGSGRRCR